MSANNHPYDSAPEQLIAQVVEEGLCVQCGTCTGGCPNGALQMKGENPFPVLADAVSCTDCGICLDICPRYATDFDAISQHFFGRAPKENEPAGVVESFWAGAITDDEVRSRAAGGGIVSGLVIHLLESGTVDGALMCGPHPSQPGGVIAKVVTTRDEMLANAGSHYRLVPVNAILAQLAEDRTKSYVLVGTGCHIAGIRNLQMANRHWRRQIVLTIGIECGMNLSPLWTRHLMGEMGVEDPASVAKFWYRATGGAGPGLVLKSGEIRDMHQTFGFPMFRLAPLFMPEGCSLCLDYYAESADITVGDHAGRDSEAYVRSPAGLEAVEGAITQGILDLRRLKVEQGHQVPYIYDFKMRRCQTQLEGRRYDGLRVPDYGRRENPADDLWEHPEDKEIFLYIRRAMREPAMQEWFKALPVWRQYRIGKLWMGAVVRFQPHEGWRHPQELIDEEGWEAFLAQGTRA